MENVLIRQATELLSIRVAVIPISAMETTLLLLPNLPAYSSPS